MLLDQNKLCQRFWRRKLRRPPPAVVLADPPPQAFLPATHKAAAQSLVAFSIVQSRQYLDREIKEPRDGVDPDLLRFSLAFVRELKRRGMPFFPFQYVRGKKEQNDAYEQGVSKAKWGQSPHNYGMAVDIVHFGKFWDLTNKQWAVIGLIGKEVARRQNLKMVWGGDWTFYDPAHWELADWWERKSKAAE